MPEALSLAPGPAATESMWPPITRVCAPPGFVATTFWPVLCSFEALTSTRTVAPERAAWRRVVPSACETLTAGIDDIEIRLPLKLPGWLFTMMTPTAPAAVAASTLSAKRVSPRVTRATLPRTSSTSKSSGLPEAGLDQRGLDGRRRSSTGACWSSIVWPTAPEQRHRRAAILVRRDRERLKLDLIAKLLEAGQQVLVRLGLDRATRPPGCRSRRSGRRRAASADAPLKAGAFSARVSGTAGGGAANATETERQRERQEQGERSSVVNRTMVPGCLLTKMVRAGREIAPHISVRRRASGARQAPRGCGPARRS